MAYLRVSKIPLFLPDWNKHFLLISTPVVVIRSLTVTDDSFTSGFLNDWIIPVSILGLSAICPAVIACFIRIKNRLFGEDRTRRLMIYIKMALRNYKPKRWQIFERVNASGMSELEFFLSGNINSLCQISDFEKFESPDYNKTKQLYLEMFIEVHRVVVKHKELVIKNNLQRTCNTEESTEELRLVPEFALAKIVWTIVQYYMTRIDDLVITRGIEDPYTDVPDYSGQEIFFKRVKRAYFNIVMDTALDNCGAEAHELREILRTFEY